MFVFKHDSNVVLLEINKFDGGFSQKKENKREYRIILFQAEK
jgi:hypothetical protein